MNDWLLSVVTTDRHKHPEYTMVLGGMRCVRIPGTQAQKGDFLYHYSDQLDAFHLWEILEATGGQVRIRTIDCDSPEVEPMDDGWVPVKQGHGKFYRAMPADREYVEQHGFQSDYVPLFAHLSRPTQHRWLHTRLYHRTATERAIAWLKNLFA